MQIVILDEQRIRLETAGGDEEELAVDGGPFGPIPMLAASLALCTASVIHSYAETARLDVDGLAIEINWDFAEDPHRIGHYTITLYLPEGVPAARHRAIIRAVDTCTVHQTLSHAPSFETVVETLLPGGAHHHHHGHQA